MTDTDSITERSAEASGWQTWMCLPAAVGFLVVAFLLIYFLVVVPFHDTPLLPPDNPADHLTDTQMLSLFDTHRVQLDSIVRLCQADLKANKTIRIVDYHIGRDGDDLSSDRLEAYNSLLRTLSIRGNGGVTAVSGEPIYVYISTSGNFDTGSEKGFAYLTTRLDDKDWNPDTGSGARTHFREIGNHWYLFYSEKW